MPGPVALIGAGEFLPAMAAFDADLLASTGRSRPRVAILPTASYPDGEEVFNRWASMGVAHFASLGAEVEPVLVRDRASADDPAFAQAVGEADLVYLSGGKPAYLLAALAGSAVGRAMADAHDRGAILAGCSAGAMVLAGHSFDFRVKVMPWPLRWGSGLGLRAADGRGPALRRVAGAVLGAHRPAGTPRLGRHRGRRRDGRGRPRRGVAGPRQCRASRSGAAADASDSATGKSSGSDGRRRRVRDRAVAAERPPPVGHSGRTFRKQSEQ